MNMPLEEVRNRASRCRPAARSRRCSRSRAEAYAAAGSRAGARIRRRGERHSAAGRARADPGRLGADVLAGQARRLPPPSRVLKDTWELIVDPFFDRGGIDKGLFWHLSASLQRVAFGYALRRAPASRSARWLASRPGRCAGSIRSSRCCAPFRRSPGCRCRWRRSATASPSAIFVIFITAIWPVIINTAVGIRNIPQDYRNVAAVLRLNHFEFFFKIMVPAAAPYIFTACASASACPGSRSSRPRC